MPRKTTKPKTTSENTEIINPEMQTNNEQTASEDIKSEINESGQHPASENIIDPEAERIKFLASLGEILIEYFPEIKTTDDLREMLSCDDDDAYECDYDCGCDPMDHYEENGFDDGAMLIPMAIPHISEKTPVIMKTRNGETRVITNTDDFLKAFIENINAAVQSESSDKKKKKKDKKKKHKNKKK